MDNIFIKNLSARGIIGINADEREQPQQIIISITLYLDTRHAGGSDNIDDTVSYSMIAKKALACAETAHRFTVEALAEDIAAFCLEEKGIEKVEVRVEKPRALRFAEAAGCEIIREKKP